MQLKAMAYSFVCYPVKINVKKSIDSVFLYANMPRIESDTSVVGCVG